MNIFLLFGYLGIIIFWVLIALLFSPQGQSLSKRLQGLQNTEAGKRKELRDQEVMNKSLITRVVLPIADKCAKFFSGITPKQSTSKCAKDIAAAGLTGKVSASQITTLSWMLMIALPAFYWFLTALKPERSSRDYFLMAIALLLGYRFPFGVIKGRANVRKNQIRKALPFTLDLISISVEAGMSFDGAMNIVAEKTRGPLTDELNLTLREIRLGKSRNQALTDLGDRAGVDDLKSFLTAVSYISKLGGSLVDVIKIQANAMRIKRRQRAEEKAMKTPVKIMIPLVLFIFPSIFIVIVVPALITALEHMQNSAIGG